MMGLKNRFFTNSGSWFILLALILTCSLVLTQLFWKTEPSILENAQVKFLEQEKKAELAVKELLLEAIQGNGFNNETDTTLIYHVYQKDSLVYWSSNKMPIRRLASLSFPTEGLVHLKNGWYYTCMAQHEGHVATVSFLVKRRYSYQNEYLINHVSKAISPSFFLLTLDEQEGYAIKNNNGDYCFSISNPVFYGKTKSITLVSIGFFTCVFFFLGLLRLKNKMLKKKILKMCVPDTRR